MWFDGIRKENTVYVASVSRGKDSTAMLRAIQLLNFPLDAIVSVDVWFDDDTPAELPPLVEFKDEWDRKCLENFCIPVTRICAQNSNVRIERERGQRDDDGECHSRKTYKQHFYSRHSTIGINGFPYTRSGRGVWCQEKIKRGALTNKNICLSLGLGAKTNIVHYIGIAADEPERIERHMKDPKKVLPLVQIGWDEALCGLEAQYLDMLSPTYDTSMRDGCWFCQNQGISPLRNLRKNYPELWQKLMKLDLDSPVSFKADGHTVHDYDRRFQMEDDGWIKKDTKFKWSKLDMPDAIEIKLF